MCQILSESVAFHRRYDKKHVGVFFSVHSVYIIAVESKSVDDCVYYH